VHPFQVLLPAERCHLGQDSKAQAEQIRPVAVERIGGVIATLPTDLVDQLDEALRVHLAV
jgi:mRNA interferase MazF